MPSFTKRLMLIKVKLSECAFEFVKLDIDCAFHTAKGYSPFLYYLE